MDYSKLSDFEVNLKLAHILLGKDNYDWNSDKKEVYLAGIDGGEFLSNGYFDPCNNPADAWPIIQSNGISLVKYEHGMWLASSDAYWVDGVEWQIDGEAHSRPLRAAMIVYLKMQESSNVPANSTGSDIR
jgi:hypothetical protein